MKQPRSGQGLWWASPVGCTLLVVPLSLYLAASTSDRNFRLLYRSPKSLDGEHTLLFFAAGAVLLGAMMISLALLPGRWPVAWPGLTDRQLQVVERAARICFWLTLVGYAAFGLAGASRGIRPAQMLAALAGDGIYEGELKAAFAPVAGITTLTQVGIAFVVLAGVLLAAGRSSGLHWRLAVVLGLAMLRAYLLTERLAIIELGVPLLLLIAVHRHRLGARGPSAAPVLALPLLVVVFGLFEYSRSWSYFRTRTDDTYMQFVLDRLAGYYATAYNNGAMTLLHGDYRGRLPYGSLEAFWTAPGIEQMGLFERLTGDNGYDNYFVTLEQHANPEFNNPCGLCTPLFDFGLLGGFAFLALAGLVIGLAYTAFRGGHPLGLLLYPIVFTGVLETPRYLYWTQGRIVPAVLVLLVVAYQLHRVEAPASRPLSGERVRAGESDPAPETALRI